MQVMISAISNPSHSPPPPPPTDLFPGPPPPLDSGDLLLRYARPWLRRLVVSVVRWQHGDRGVFALLD